MLDFQSKFRIVSDLFSASSLVLSKAQRIFCKKCKKQARQIDLIMMRLLERYMICQEFAVSASAGIVIVKFN